MKYQLTPLHLHRKLDQKGMAAIIVTMVTMVVISLIVLGFATISRREQSQTLDQQLSTQAFYAAETGVEDAKNVIQAAIQAGKEPPAKTDCDTNTTAGYTPNYPTGAGAVIDSGHGVSYTCLLVDPTPDSLEYNGVGADNLVVPVNIASAATSIQITWKPTTPPTGSPSTCASSATNSFSLQSKWNCGYGLLRMDMVPTAGSLTRSGLASNTLTTFFMPTRNGASGQISYSGNTNRPNIIAANCTLGSYSQCTARITNLAAHRNFSLRLNSLYQPSDLSIVALNGSAQLGLSGAQAKVDVTGKANDVLRRIQVRVPVGAAGESASFAIQTNGALCKRFKVTPNYLSIPGDIVDPDPTNDMCRQQTYGTPQAGG